MPVMFSPQERETIRQLLFEKGMILFEKFGVKKTTVQDLADAAGISKGAFYQFFPSKEELLMQILERIENEIHTRLLDLTFNPDSNNKNKLRELLKATLLTRTNYPLLTHFNQSDLDYLIRKLPPQRIKQHIEQDRDFASIFLEKTKKMGVTIRIQPQLVAGLFRSLFFVSLHKDDFSDEVYDESIQVLVDLIAGYLIAGE